MEAGTMKAMTGMMVVAAASTAAFGQLVVPPTKKPAETPEYVAPAQPPQQPPGGLTVTPGKAAPAAPAKAEVPADLKWESLVKLDEEGGLIALDRPEWYAALDVNPLIEEETKPRLAALIAERQRYFEPIVLDNLDLLMQIEEGGEGLQTHAMLSNVGRALAGDRAKSFTNELRNRGLLNPVQLAVHERIIKEYHAAEMGPMPTREGAGRGVTGSYERSILRQSSAEARYSWERMLLEGWERFDEVNGKASAFKGNGAAELKKKVGAAKSEREKVLALRGAAMALELDEHREFLRAVIGTRGAK